MFFEFLSEMYRKNQEKNQKLKNDFYKIAKTVVLCVSE